MFVCFKLFIILSLFQHTAVANTSKELNGIARLKSPTDFLTEWQRIGRTISRQTAPVGLRLHDPAERQVLMINGTADDAFVATCYPEPGFNSSSYKLVFKSDNQQVLNASADITWSHVFGNRVSNISVLVDFNRFPGKTTLTLEARRIRDQSLFDSVSVQFLAAGLVIYKNDTNEIVSGAGRSLTIESYKDLYENPQMELAAFAQYLNGSDSRIALGRLSSSTDTFSIFDIMPHFHCSGQILWDSDVCSVTDATWNGTATVLKRGCGMGFANEYSFGGRNTELHFALYFEKHRAGECLMVFDWKRFTLNTTFDDEEYTTFLDVEILGQPPAVVRRIEPSNPFSPDGGEQLHVEMINTADVNITSFNVHNAKFLLVNGSHRYITGPDDYYETATFLTEPGTGRNLPWTISGTRLSETGNSSEPVAFLDQTGFRFSYDDDILTLDSITPNTTAESGGEEIILRGSFSSFSATAEHHNVLFGNIPIDHRYIISVSSTEIRFRAPPRALIGLERLLTVTVQVEHSFSNSLSFIYLSSHLNLKGYAFGASFDVDKRSQILSSCGNTTFMVTAENYDDSSLSYRWNILDKEEFDNSTISLLNETSLSYLSDSANVLELPNSIFPEYGVAYSVIAEVSVGNLSSSYKFIAQKSRNIVAGVTLIQPDDRFKALPAVNLRIVAKVDIPECFVDPTELKYEWTYQTEGTKGNAATNESLELPSNLEIPQKSQLQQFVFSHENSTGPADDFLSPMRLGGEMMIPREYLTYGVHLIHLTVRDRDQPRFYGKAVTTVNVLESSLIPLIGNGSATRMVADSEPLHLSANASFDPDVPSESQMSSELTFSWKCMFSFFANFSEATICDDDLLPVTNHTGFTIPSATLQKKTNALQKDEEKLYIRYILAVREGRRFGEASQVLVVVKSNGKRIAQSQKVEILDSEGEPVDRTRVKFWEDVIIQPVAPNGTQWSFRLDLPYEESARFMAGNENLISSPGYYTTTGKSVPYFDRSPLGILAGKLSPHQLYQFTITFRQAGMLSKEVTIRLKTVELPRLLFPPLGRNSGTVDTIFRSSATTSFNSNGTFVYQFYLMDLGNLDSEYCVDGCSGVNVVRFQVSKPGHYTLQCRLLSADGKSVLVVMNNRKTIVVSASSSVISFEETERLMWKDYYLGKDGAVNQRAFYLAEGMYNQNSGVISIPENDQSETCANLTSLWSGLARGFVQRDLPNTPRARNYVRIAISCVRLRCFEREESLYDLLYLVDTAISRIPSEESLSVSSHGENSDTPELELPKDLMTFYNLSMSFAISSFAGGSSRDRLVASHGEVSNIIIDLGELWTKHVTAVAASGQVCGWEATYTSQIFKQTPDNAVIASKAVVPTEINTMRVAVRCTPEQGVSMTTPFASFGWCDAVYDLTGNEKKLITLAETVDFPYFSRVQGQNKTDSARLVSVDISMLGEGNKLIPALSESMVAAQAQESNDETNSCYRIGMAMKTDSDVRSDTGAYNIPFVMQPRKAFGKILTQPFEGGYYRRRTDRIIVTPETRNSSDLAVARSNTLGLYGVEKANNRSTSDKLHGNLEGTGFELIGFLIGIIILILIIALIVVVIVWLILSSREPTALETTEAYIDRDSFGRRDVRLPMGSTDSASVTTTGESGNSAISGRDRNIGLEDENMLGTSIPEAGGDQVPR